MDKRLLYTLVLCFGILFVWNTFVNPPVRPKPPIVAPGQPVQTGNPALADKPGDKPGAAPAPAVPEAKPTITPVIADTQERITKPFIVGAPGRPGYYQATFSNKGAVLEKLRTGNHFDRAGLTPEEQAETNGPGEKVHWQVLVSPSPSSLQQPNRTLSLRTAPSSADLVRAPLETELWSGGPVEGMPSVVEYTLSPGQGVTFVKRFRFLEGSDQVRLELEIRNDGLSDPKGLRSFVLTTATGVPNDSGDSYYQEPQAIAFSRAGGEDADPVVVPPDWSGENRGGTLAVAPPISFAGVFNKYFAVLLRPGDEAARLALAGASWRAVHDDTFAAQPGAAGRAWRQMETDVDLQLKLPATGQSSTWTFDVYAGTKGKQDLASVSPDFTVLVEWDLGFTSGIAKLLLWILGAFYDLTHSWGTAIILLTITVRAVLFPINRRSQTAMARYQVKIKRIQPRIEEIKKKYEKDPTKLRQEQARIMQEEDALMPPLGGCLPPLLQIPIFIGLYRALGVSFDLRHASFMGWIDDLSLPDQLVRIDWNLPLVGHVPYLNVLPPLMVVMWIWQQRSMPKPTDPQAATMYKMMLFMPVVMGVFLYNYAAGLSLYMITQSTLGILEQKIIRKYWPVDDTPAPKKKRSGFMQKILAAQQEKMKEVEAQRLKKKKAAARR